MKFQQKLTAALALILAAACARAIPVVYVLTDAQQFGKVDLATGVFTPIGPGLSDPSGGLVYGSGGNLLTLTFAGNLNSIDPTTGVSTLIGATGLGDCSLPTSACGPTSANILGKLGSTIYATDLSNNLYSVNPTTGTASLIGPTGIPAVPFPPHTPVPGDSDGAFTVFDESLFDFNGKLYANFAAGTFDPVTFTPTPSIDPHLYQINPTTGVATLIAPTSFGLSTIVAADGQVYAFDTALGEVVTLDLTNGNISYLSDADQNAGLITGALSTTAPVPEPASLALVGSGLAAIATAIKHHRHQR